MAEINKDDVVIYASKDEHLHAYDWLKAQAAYCASSAYKSINDLKNDVTSCEISKFKDSSGNPRYEINFFNAFDIATYIRTDRTGLQKLLREIQMFLLIKD